jgi:hypothetical protein
MADISQEADGSESTRPGLVESQPAECALRGIAAFRKRPVKEQRRVQQFAQLVGLVVSPALDLLPRRI